MSLTYRNPGAWGSGKGARLSSLEGDNNIYTLDQRVAAIEIDSGGKTIDYFAQDVHTGQLYIHYTDHSIDGPFDLPTMEWAPTGPYLGDNAYQKNQIFFIDGSLYLVLRDHTSPSHFDAFANDGSGHDFYALILMNPGNVIPDGGTTGQVLAKISDHDFDTDWIDLFGVPVGGDTGQVLKKHSDSDGDTVWGDIEGIVPAGGLTAGMALVKHTSSDYDMEWKLLALTDLTGDVSPDQKSLISKGFLSTISSNTVIDPTTGDVFAYTIGADLTLSVSSQIDGQLLTIILVSSGTTSRTVTFGSGFKSTGTLATGTVNNKVFAITFVNTQWWGSYIETSRIGTGF